MSAERKVLELAIDRLSDESRWTKGTWARCDNGYSTRVDDPKVECLCTGGAIIREIMSREAYSEAEGYVVDADYVTSPMYEEIEKAVVASAAELGFEFSALAPPCIPAWNDSPDVTHKDVLEVLNNALERLPE